MIGSTVFLGRFRQLMFDSKYTQKQIAQMCQITEASLSRYMNGERMPKPEILANLATALRTTTDYLLGKDEPGYAEIRTLIARSAQRMTDGQRKELSNILMGINERLEQEVF